MSDYIRREDVLGIISSGWSNHYSCKDMCDEIKELPTLDEKEIIRKKMERIIDRIEKARQKYQRLVKEQGKKEDEAMNIHFRGMIKIIKEEGGIE